MESVEFQSCAPVWPSQNVAKTARWYQDMLGFEVSLHGHAPNYAFAIVSQGRVELMFRCVSAWTWWRRPSGDWDVYVRVSDVTALYHRLKEKGVRVIVPLTIKEYPQVEFVVGDVDGRRLVFASPVR
jgi:catechol 2,3-dioxygenase-like lactoylglutathione lyase family enzyme